MNRAENEKCISINNKIVVKDGKKSRQIDTNKLQTEINHLQTNITNKNNKNENKNYTTTIKSRGKTMFYKTLPKKEVIDAIEGKRDPSRTISTFTVWPPDPTKNILRQVRALLRYPSDIKIYYPACYLPPLMKGCINLGFDTQKHKAQTNADGPKVTGYSDEELAPFFKRAKRAKTLFCHPVPWCHRYRLGILWNCIFETSWQVRGMENLLMDFYLDPDGVHKMFRGITDFYKTMIVKYKRASNCDGILITDDLGTQVNTMFSRDIFKEFFLPYYKEISDTAHAHGMHVWFHTCGCVGNFVDLFIESGFDVLHPIQKFANNEYEIFEKYKNQITFLYGFDVQQAIPYGTVEEVREEVHRGVDLFSQAKGKFIYTAGNGITADCPIESYEALLEESRVYNPYKAKREKESQK